jgi:hypothetical protein
VDPLAEKHPHYVSYAYVYNNPLLFIDPMGLDSTFYIRNYSNGAVDNMQIKQVKDQIQNDLDQNKIPMETKQLKPGEYVKLDKTDVMIDIVNDKHSLMAKEKSENPNTEGISPVGSQLGLATAGVMERKGINETGLGNIVFHEGLHAMGLSHKTHGAPNTVIYPEGGHVTTRQINSRIQKLSSKQIDFILNTFLKNQGER